jgi:hopanoid biosynthesis associated RND transporter like protein HpnN
LTTGRKSHHISSLLISAIYRGAWPIIIFTLITGALAIYHSYYHLKMVTSRDVLVASSERLIQLSKEIDRQFGSRDNLVVVVVVENTNLTRSIQFVETLARECRQCPEEFRDLFYRVDPEKFKKWALLYVDEEQLQEFKQKLLEHYGEMKALAADSRLFQFFQVVNKEITQALIGHVFTGFLEDEQKKKTIPDLGFLQATLRQMDLYLSGSDTYTSPLKEFFPGEFTDLSQEGYFLVLNDKYLLVLVTTQEGGYTEISRSLEKLRELVKNVQARFPGLQVGVTGPGALEADEMTSSMKDVGIASWLSLICQMLLITFFFRSLKRAMVQGLVLFLGLCWTFGIATLVVGRLNILSIVFGPLLLGIAVDFGIHWYSRFEEEQGSRPRGTMDNWNCTMRLATPGIFYSALIAVVSVFPLTFTGFKGLAELGLIMTLGISLHIFLSLAFLPALAIVTEKCLPSPRPTESECGGQPQPFMSIRWRHPKVIVLAGLVVTVIGGICLFYVPFDLNPLHLQNPQTESVVWEMKLVRESTYSTSYGTMMVSGLKKLPETIAALKKLKTVSHVESILSFLPSDVEAKQRLLKELAPVINGVNFTVTPRSPSKPAELANLLGRIHFKLAQAEDTHWEQEDRPTQEQLNEVNRLLLQAVSLLNSKDNPWIGQRLAGFEQKFLADLQDSWEMLRENIKWAAHPPDIKDLPKDVRERFVSKEGNYLIRIFPSQDIWNPEPLGRFVHDLRRIDPDVVGDPVLLYTFTREFRNACIWAAGMALLGIAILIFFLFRSLVLMVLALIPLIVGTALTLSMMWLLDVPFNQANVLFLPLILGEGVEYGIIILTRWQLEESAREITLPANTAKGILLAALTTALGFGSLMISGHRGTFSLGLLSTIGSLCVLLAALSILPALLRLLRERRGALSSREEGSKR